MSRLPPARRLGAALVLAVSAAAVALLFAGMRLYSTTTEALDAHPLVTDLTRAGVAARIGYGGDEASFVASDFGDADWPSATLPLPVNRDIRNQPGSDAAGAAFAYYRVRVPISDELMASGEDIAFSPMYVSHPAFEIYVAGRLMLRGDARQRLFPAAVVGIPREAVRGGAAVVVIKGEMGPGYIGIAHRGSVYVGPRAQIDRIHVHVERAMGSYFLLFLVAKVSIFVVFALFFLFDAGVPALASFLVYACFGALEHLFSGDFFSAGLGFPAMLAGLFGAKTLSVLALGVFWVEYFRGRSLPRPIWVGVLAVATGVAALAYEYGAGRALRPGLGLFAATDWLLLGTVATGLVAGVMAARRRAREAALRRRLDDVHAMIAAIAVYLTLIVLEFTLHPFAGFDRRPAFDLLLFLYLAVVMARTFARREATLLRQREELARARVHAAIARATQMLAHDVRRPFSLLRAALGELRGAEEPALRAVLERVGPELDRALVSVDGMVADIMAIDAPPRAGDDVVPAEELLKEAVGMALRSRGVVEGEGGVEVSYSLELDRPLAVDRGRVLRALANIAENALDALAASGKRRLWVRTAPARGARPEMGLVVIGNDGPVLAPEDGERLFEAFFTRGKRNGTGLGLAIARKVARDHGGEIWCESGEGKGTEFVLRLPVVREGAGTGTGTVVPPSEALEIIVVDDSPFILDTWQRAPGLRAHTASDLGELKSLVAGDAGLLTRCAAVVTDYYLDDSGGKGTTGADVARWVARLRPDLPVLVATDAPLAADVLGGFAARLDKDTPSLEALLAALGRRAGG